MTHLLIPIENYYDVQKGYSNASDILRNAKQISLSEEDIKAKALKTYWKSKETDNVSLSDFTQGYKQALKDLLKNNY